MSSTEQYYHQHHTMAEQPGVRQAIKVATAATVALSCLTLSGITMTSTVLGVVVVTPLLVLFSPVLVPAVIAICLAGAGLLFSGGCGAAAVGMVSWVYSYFKGNHPVGADTLDRATHVVKDVASDVKEKVLDAKDAVTAEVADTADRTIEVKERRDKGRKGSKAQDS